MVTTNYSHVEYCNITSSTSTDCTAPISDISNPILDNVYSIFLKSRIRTASAWSVTPLSQQPVLLSVVTIGLMVVVVAVFFATQSKSTKSENQRKERWRRLCPWRRFFPTGTGRTGNDENNTMMARKIEFLSRNGDYGYKKSDLGYIDDWRPREFPMLQRPLGFYGYQNEKKKRPDDEISEREVYLDYAGSALAGDSVLKKIYRDTLSKGFSYSVPENF